MKHRKEQFDANCGSEMTKNKAEYTATLAACGWAGAAKKAKRDGLTDRLAQPTDGQSGL